MKPLNPLISLAAIAFLSAQPTSHAAPPDDKDLAQQIFDTMLKVPGNQPGFRPVHAKGIVCHGTFAPTADAASLSRAAHFQSTSVPVIVRFSDGAHSPSIADNSPDANPRGMAIRFLLPGNAQVDIVAMSHNGFVVSNGQEFLELQKSIVATDPTKPHPWPIEAFLTSHPAALKFVQDNVSSPVSFATESFFSNDSFTFTNKDGAKQVGRYKIIPDAGKHDLSDEDAKTKSPNFLIDEIKARLATGPVTFHLIIQLPNANDPTNDPSIVWPDDRKTVDVGLISITSVDVDSDSAQRSLAFDPTNLADGIDLSDDTLPTLRSSVYALSVAHRQANK